LFWDMGWELLGLDDLDSDGVVDSAIKCGIRVCLSAEVGMFLSTNSHDLLLSDGPGVLPLFIRSSISFPSDYGDYGSGVSIFLMLPIVVTYVTLRSGL